MTTVQTFFEVAIQYMMFSGHPLVLVGELHPAKDRFTMDRHYLHAYLEPLEGSNCKRRLVLLTTFDLDRATDEAKGPGAHLL